LFGWEEPDDTDLVKDGAAAIRTLGNAIDTSMGDLLGGTTGQVLSKASNTNMDFTWVTSDDANAIQNTIVDAKGDLIAASASDTPARIAAGNNGEVLVPDSSTSTGLRYQPIQTRNCTYNSAMDIWQRGTSFTANGYTADRWYAVTAGVAGRTISRVAGSGQFQYLTRIQRTAGNTATNGVDFGQSFEIADATAYAGKTVTFSFYARKGGDFSAGSSTMNTYVFSGTSSTETNRVTTAYPSGGTTAGSGAVTLTTTLQRFQYTFTFGATVTQFAFVFSVGFGGTAGAADYVDITGVQLEVGSVATDYVRQGATIQGELAACQRYYYRLGAGGGGNTSGTQFGYYFDATASSSTNLYGILNYPVTMRKTPTSVDYFNVGWIASWGAGVNAISAIAIYDGSNVVGSTPHSAVFTMTTTGATTNSRYFVLSNNTTAGYLGVSAEL
jgi:hypothetical protein